MGSCRASTRAALTVLLSKPPGLYAILCRTAEGAVVGEIEATGVVHEAAVVAFDEAETVVCGAELWLSAALLSKGQNRRGKRRESVLSAREKGAR